MTTPFRLSKDFVSGFAKQEPKFGFNGLGRLVFERTYSRLKPGGGKEQWYETVERVVNGVYTTQKRWIESHGLGWDENKGQESAMIMYSKIYNFKFLPPGRGLYAMGSEITEERGLNAALFNCSFISTANLAEEGSYPFRFAMDALMVGVGVGHDTLGADSIILEEPSPDGSQTFIIPDSREGWVEALGKLIDSYFISGSVAQQFDYSLVRPAGQPIRGFGGLASGPEPLRNLLEDVRLTLRRDVGKGMSVTSIVDIMNMIGKCVVSGNVRRSAILAMGDHDSDEFMQLKNYDINPQRQSFGWASNNSVSAELGMDYSKYTENIIKNGEPGFIWLDNMREFSRMDGTADYKDKRVMGVNPCVTGDTRILTDKGLRVVNDLIGKQFTAIVNGKPYLSTEKGFWLTDTDRQIKKVLLDNGLYLRCTDNHKIQLKDGSWVEAGKLQSGDLVNLSRNTNFVNNGDDGTFTEGYVIGQLIGDGTFEITLQGNNKACIDIWLHEKYEDKYDYEPLRFLEEYAKTLDTRSDFKGFNYAMTTSGGYSKYRMSCVAISKLAEKYRIHPKIKTVYEHGSHGFNCGMLSGLFDADGTIRKDHRKGNSVRLTQIDLERLEAVQRLLFSLGISSKIFKNRRTEGYRSLPDGKGGSKSYLCQTLHELIISRQSIVLFRDIIGFKDNDKRQLLDDLIDEYRRQPYTSHYDSSVISVSDDGVEDVYDATIPGANCFSANGILAHNCGEIPLESGELCCLSDVFIDHHDDLNDFLQTLKFAYLYAKTVTLCKVHWSKSNRLNLRNRRVGCSLSGIAQFISHRGHENLRQWLEDGYATIQRYDNIYSSWFCIPLSIKTTTIKPSGSVSLLAGATPGCHWPESRFYIRRVRLAEESDLLPGLIAAGYPVEKDAYGPNTMVVSFPIDCGEGIRVQSEVSMWEQFALLALLQRVWADNSVSCTITFDPETEGPQIEAALNYYQYQAKSVSLLPRIKSGAYAQMPYEKIDETTYLEMSDKLKKLKLESTVDAESERFCTKDSCEVLTKE